MKKPSLQKQIDDLKKEIQDLKSRPHITIVPYQQQLQYPQQPWNPINPPPWISSASLSGHFGVSGNYNAN